MLFNSYIFLFVFAPVAVLGFHLLRPWFGLGVPFYALLAFSLAFYSFWQPIYLWVLIGSMLVNFVIGRAIVRVPRRSSRALVWLVAGLVFNIALLGVFKYIGFAAETANGVFGVEFAIIQIALPLGLSFHTFQQIAFLVDAYRGEDVEPDVFRYGLFIAFFPQLIAGPIVRHHEIAGQLFRKLPPSPTSVVADLEIGLTIFLIGLFKKVVLADSVAVYANTAFGAANTGAELTFLEAWVGALAYTFQIYFDFSAYSDMAVGLALMFGVRLPVNFLSPYKASSIIEFWRRWHMSLSSFLRDYLYIPMGGSRRSRARQYANILATMLIGGLWHGAGWTFVIWGGLHGIMIVCNHIWRGLFGRRPRTESIVSRWFFRTFTFTALVVTWVVFRADSVESMAVILKGMAGLNGFVLFPEYFVKLGAFGDMLQEIGMRAGPMPFFIGKEALLWIGLLWIVAWAFPNVTEIFAHRNPVLLQTGQAALLTMSPIVWRPSAPWALASCVMFVAATMWLSRVHEFLYFQF